MFWVYLLFIVYLRTGKSYFYIGDYCCSLDYQMNCFEHWLIYCTKLKAYYFNFIYLCFNRQAIEGQYLYSKVNYSSWFFSYILFQSTALWSFIFYPSIGSPQDCFDWMQGNNIKRFIPKGNKFHWVHHSHFLLASGK